jgi:hypothetical protein
MTNCLNCENPFEGSFCNSCGQKAATHRFSMHEWLHEIPHSLFHVDSGFFQTVKTLLARPGNAVREYLEGRRKLLFSPFLYVLIWCGVYVVLSHFFAKPEVAAEHPELNSLKEAVEYIESHYYKIIVVAMILPVTLGSFFAYYRAGYNFAEHLVLNAYLIGQLVIADIILLLLLALTNEDKRYIRVLIIVQTLLKFPYWFWMYWQFFKPQKWYWGILQFILSQIINGIALYGLLFGAGFALLKLKGH